MEQQALRERQRIQKRAQTGAQKIGARLEQVSVRPKIAPRQAQKPAPQPARIAKRYPNTVPISRPDEARRAMQEAQERIRKQESDARVQHELQDLRTQHDLDEVDDDVENLATLMEWRALEHNHQPKTQTWYIVLAASVAVISVGFALFGNIMAAITIGFAGALTYYVAQQEPRIVRYRIMTEGLAFNNVLYHYQDLQSFNVVYYPGETKAVFLKSKRPFAPLLHMEIGDADPVAIRDLLLEFVHEDQELYEPLIDIYARRLGF